MSAIVTNNYRLLSADVFYDKVYNMNVVNPGDTDIKNLYFFIGRPRPWDAPYNDVNPTPPASNVNNINQCYMDMFALKKIDVGENITFSVPRYDWVSSVVYAMYDDQDTDLYNHPSETDLDIAAIYASANPGDSWVPGSYYVVTDEWDVYECLFNGYGPYGIDGLAAKSTVKPTGGPQAGATRFIVGPLLDGYVWKYLYTLSQADIDKYVTESWLPVKHLTSNDGSDQWNVQTLADNAGSIDIIKITSVGDDVSWYGLADGAPASFDSVSSPSDIYLTSANIPASSTYENDQVIVVPNAPGTTFYYTVASYDYNNEIITTVEVLDPGISAATHKIYVAPKVTIVSNVTDPGDQCTARAIIDPSNKVHSIQIITNGVGYHLASVQFAGKLLSGIILNPSTEECNTVARAIIPPTRGHGENPKIDLGAWFVMLSTKFQNIEGGTDFPTLNDYRRMGLIRDVEDFGSLPLTPTYSTAPTLRACKTLDVDNIDLLGTSGFIPDEKIAASVTKSAYVIEFQITGQDVNGYIGNIKYYQDETTGFVDFEVGDTVVGDTSTIQGIVTALNEPEYEPYTGQVLYIEQRRPIVRAPEQTEEIRTVIEF